jgi:chromatin remodeling complex protein RSC6
MSAKKHRKHPRKTKKKPSRKSFGEILKQETENRKQESNIIIKVIKAPYQRSVSVTGASRVSKSNSAFMRPVQPDRKLAAIVGSRPLPRSELTRKLWDYIKKNGCQDKKKRTMINADDSLRPIFNGKSQVSMFELTKLMSGHMK